MGWLMVDKQVDIIFGKNSPRLSDILKLYESTAPDADGYVEEWGTLRLAEQTLDDLDPDKKEAAFSHLRNVIDILYNTIDRHYTEGHIPPLLDHNQQGLDLDARGIKFDFKAIEYAVTRAHGRAKELYSANEEKLHGVVYEEDIASLLSLKNTLNAPYNEVNDMIAKSAVQLNDTGYSENLYLVKKVTHNDKTEYEIAINGSILPKMTGTMHVGENNAFGQQKIRELFDAINRSPYREEMLKLEFKDYRINLIGANKSITAVLNKVEGQTQHNWRPADISNLGDGLINVKKLQDSVADPSQSEAYNCVGSVKGLVRFELLVSDIFTREVLAAYFSDVAKKSPAHLPRLAEILDSPQLAEMKRAPLTTSDKHRLFGDQTVNIIAETCGMHNIESKEYLGKIKHLVHLERILDEMEKDDSFPKLPEITRKTLDTMKNSAECFKNSVFISSLLSTLSGAIPESVNNCEGQNQIQFTAPDARGNITTTWPKEFFATQTLKGYLDKTYENDLSKDVPLLQRYMSIKAQIEGLISLKVISMPSAHHDLAQLGIIINNATISGIKTPLDVRDAATGLVDGAGKIYHPEGLILWKGQFPRVKEMAAALHPDNGIELKFKDNRISGKEAGLVKQLEDTLKFHRKPKETQALLNILSVISLIKSPEKGGDITAIKDVKAEGNEIILGEDKIPFDYKSIQKAMDMAKDAVKDKGANLEADFNALIEKFSATIFENYITNPVAILGQRSTQDAPLFTTVRMKEDNCYKILIDENALEHDLGSKPKAGASIIAMKNKVSELQDALAYFNECDATALKNGFDLSNVKEGALKNKLESMCGVELAFDDHSKLAAIRESLIAQKGSKQIMPRLSILMTENNNYNVTISPGEKITDVKKEAINVELEKMGFTVTRGTNNIKIKEAPSEKKDLLENVFFGANELARKNC